MKNYSVVPFQFQINDSPFTLQPISLGDLEKVTNLGDILSSDPAKGVAAIRELVQGKSNARTADAVLSLPPKNVLDLIKDWAGITPGESSTSGDE